MAYLSYLKRQSEILSRCVGRVVWAEHEHYDVLELPASREQLQALLAQKGINWTRLPNHRYWGAEELHAYDYVLYAGQDIQKARLTLDSAPPSPEKPTPATLLNLANLVPRQKWPHNSRDVETAWIQMPTPETRLDHQFEVIKDCCLGLAWSLFSLALPGFSKHEHPARAEMEGAMPVELPVPRPLPPELSALREVQELPGSEVDEQCSVPWRAMSHTSTASRDSLYDDPRHDVARDVKRLHVRPPQASTNRSFQLPPDVYEMPG